MVAIWLGHLIKIATSTQNNMCVFLVNISICPGCSGQSRGSTDTLIKYWNKKFILFLGRSSSRAGFSIFCLPFVVDVCMSVFMHLKFPKHWLMDKSCRSSVAVNVFSRIIANDRLECFIKTVLTFLTIFLSFCVLVCYLLFCWCLLGIRWIVRSVCLCKEQRGKAHLLPDVSFRHVPPGTHNKDKSQTDERDVTVLLIHGCAKTLETVIHTS